MTINTLVRHYDRLGAEERFRLILAAGARDDEAEQDRLCRAAPRIALTYSHHAPWAHAFDELATLVFVELLEEVAKHQDACERWWDVAEDGDDEGDDDASPDDSEDEGDDCEDEGHDCEEDVCKSDAAALASNGQEPPIWARMLELHYAQGFMLKTKIIGWKRFCERLTLPSFILWQPLPGFDRLQCAIELVENREKGPPPAFEPEGMMNWLNQVRSDGRPEVTLEKLLSPDRFAADLEAALRHRVKMDGG